MSGYNNHSTDSDRFSEETEQKLRRKLKYFFMNPCDKFTAKRKFPWKLTAQLIKIILVTVQLALFGFSRSSHVDFLEKSNVAFRHLYLQNWDASYETMPYPPATGAFAIYTIPAFYDSVNYAMRRYDQTEKLAIGTYHFNHPNDTKPLMEMCKVRYKKGKIYAYNHTYVFDAKTVEECFPLKLVNVTNSTTGEPELVYDVEEYLKSINESILFDRIIRIYLKFAVSTVHIKTLTSINTPDCYIFNVTVTYDNKEHNGQMRIDLKSFVTPVLCFGTIDYDNDAASMVAIYVIFDGIVILLCLLSTILCLRSIYKAQLLKRYTVNFFESVLDKKLDIYDRLEFFNLWYVMIIINDIFIVIGSALKMQIELKFTHNYEGCGLLLGTGNLLVWFGVLRYLKFFDTYNILILTMKKSAPNILRFLVCASVFYFGFTVCGWVVLGPYHIKFRSISTTSECLFSLVNGDDMFVTFSVINSERNLPPYMWYFSRIYLYIFVSVFIYVVLNLFIAVILDTYEVIKFRYVSTASECLFSLINGDDMFVTFQAIKGTGYIWWYSQVFLYGFISLFIYVILSVFLSVILDTYETIKDYYEHGFPKTELHEFIDKEDEVSGSFRDYNTSGCCAVASLACLRTCSCCGSEPEHGLSVQSEDFHTSLIT